MQEDDNDKMMAYERMRDSADEMAEQKNEMNKQLKAAGAQDMISSPEQIEDEVNSRMDQQANGERFGQRAEDTLAALNDTPVTLKNAGALDQAAAQSRSELKEFLQETKVKDAPQWVDNTDKEIEDNRKKVHETAMQLEHDFGGSTNDAGSLLEVPKGGSLMQSAAFSQADAAQEKLNEHATDLVKNFDQNFKRQMAVGFAEASKKETSVDASGNLREQA